MGFGDVIGLMVGMGALVGMFAIIGQMYRRRLEHKERIAEIKANGAQGQPQQSTPERDATIERLEHRIRVLERIATDKTASLALQIEDLREPAN
ncbi:hypothetical protein [Novosphingobium sp.]|uniref:hypothetical protein n=1 Tax=Novosphingobium sp. TaxID=1874826 RepID=UPI0025FB44EC|nr:hypothetical protein [Novosphingobium sp.]MCC6925181.1 hypothetical protein [Novosphingobium sp.]